MAENDGRNYTTNLEMVLPKQSEQYNVDDFNGNFQKIDDFAGQTPSRALVADELKTARKINGVDFKGDQDITIPTVNLSGDQTVGGVKTFSETIQGNIASATKAIQDRNGDVIDETYMKTADLTDQIYQSKAKESGNISFDKTVLDDIIKYKYSSFDRSKFTVVGSPNITDDGIASGFSKNNIVTISEDYIGGKSNFEVRLKIRLGSSAFVDTQRLISNSVSNTHGILVSITQDRKLRFIGIDTDGTDIGRVNGQTTLSLDTTYYILIKFDGHNYKVYSSTNNTTWTEEINIASTSLIRSRDGMTLGLSFPSEANVEFKGTIDLKQFSITVDGVPVFSGNKTGVDTIKPDDYTVVGTPTISADGILSGFQKNANADLNYLYYDQLPNGWFDNFVIEISGIYGGSGNVWGSHNVGCSCTLSDTLARFYVPGGNSFVCNLGGTLSVGDYYKIICSNKNDNQTITVATKYGVHSETATLTSSGTQPSNRINIASAVSGSYGIAGGSIDLNAFKIYVDGNLIYQPMLKIPYTQSSEQYGSKVVDEKYRDRVEDAFEQGFEQKYFTLQENKKGNYEIIGTPTITNDFIASDFSGSNRIKTYFNYEQGTLEFTEGFYFQTDSDAGNIFQIRQNNNSSNVMGVYQNSNDNLVLYAISGESISISSSEYSPSANDFIVINLKLNTNKTMTYTITNITKNITITKTSSNTIQNEPSSSGNVLYIGNANGNEYYAGSVDLKTVKIKNNGELIYEAVIDSNFTLPMGELYGMIEQRVKKQDLKEIICIIEEYAFSDANAFCWDLSNGWRIQGARQTVTSSGTITVPLLKPFTTNQYLAFKNYCAGVGTQLQDNEGSIFGKTTTSFQTNNLTSDTNVFDWIAIGR